MKDLYARFGLTTDLETEVEKFRTKLNNLLISSKFGSEVLEDREDDITWRFANYIGEAYNHPSYTGSKVQFILPSGISLNEFLFRLQVVLDLLWESRQDAALTLGGMVDLYLGQSIVGLGYFVKTYKTKPPQILPASNRRQQNKIINTIDQLEIKPDKYSAAIEHYESGIKEFLAAKTKAQLKDVVEDMSTACDSVVKAVFKDENLGFKHIFKEKRWEKIKLNDTEKRIFSDINNTIDQIKHGVLKGYTRENVETIVYLASSFIEKVAK